MAEWGSGSFTPGVYDKVIPGAYVIISVAPNGNYTVAERGYAAAMMELPGGEDNAIIALTKEQFEKNSEKYFGVPYDDDSMLPLRELFSKAHTAYIYRLNSGGEKAKGAAGEAKYSGEVGNNISVTVSRNADNEVSYDVATYYNGVLKDSQNVPETSEKEIVLTKGTESDGEDVKPMLIEKWGYVKNKSDLESIPGLSGNNLEADKNIFYFRFPNGLTNGENYSAFLDIDGEKYALPLWNLKPSNRNVYLWMEDTDVTGTFKLNGETWNPNTSPVDVTGKTVKVSLYNYGKKVTADVLKGEPTEKLIDEVEVTCSDNTENGEVGGGTPAEATFSFANNTITVEFSDVPEGYTPSVKVKNGSSYASFKNGEIESSVEDSKVTVTYYPSANISGEKTVEAILSKSSSTVIKSCTYTCEAQDKGEKGADASKLKDNDYIIFDKKAILVETGGDVFSGGSLGAVKGSNYAEAKDLFEAYHFNTLALPSTDKTTQDMFVEYTKHMRDEEGVKFQLVIPHSPERNDSINYEGVIEYSPINTVTDEKYKDNGLTFWLAGAEAACPVQSNLTGLVYDGEFEVEAKVTRVQQRSSIMGGQVLFNKMGDSVVLLRDINTLTSVEEGSTSKSDDFKKNQTIRVLDGLVQETADCFNNFFVRQHLANTEVNRAELRNQLIKIRQRYATIGAINGYDESLMQIEPGEKLSDVIGNDGVSVSGAMEFLYFSLRLVQETV